MNGGPCLSDGVKPASDGASRIRPKVLRDSGQGLNPLSRSRRFYRPQATSYLDIPLLRNDETTVNTEFTPIFTDFNLL